jgi:hypothetical protein
MTGVIPNLWPNDIKATVASPLAILRAQGGYLEEQTKGILSAEVVTREEGEELLHAFNLVAPALDMYRHHILDAKHHKNLQYPVQVLSEYPKRRRDGIQLPPLPPSPALDRLIVPPTADSDDEFIALVGKILHSADVKALMASLVARSNEVTRDVPDETPPSAEQDKSEGPPQ